MSSKIMTSGIGPGHPQSTKLPPQQKSKIEIIPAPDISPGHPESCTNLTQTQESKIKLIPTTIFGQLVVGPPGSGKSTYCKLIAENLIQLGRKPKIINLDPANDCLRYKPFADIASLVNVETVMERKGLGPNGATLICLEFLEKKKEWLYDTIIDAVEQNDKEFKFPDEQKQKPYLIFDCPGQSELYTHHTAMKNIVRDITKKFDLRLACINLCDAHYACDFSKYIGVVINSLSTMLNLELPHVNILSKVDILEKNGKTRFNLDFYTEVMDLRRLLECYEDDPFYEKYRKLTESIISIIEDYSLVTFTPLNIKKPEDIYAVLQHVDKANGYFIDDLDLTILQSFPAAPWPGSSNS